MILPKKINAQKDKKRGADVGGHDGGVGHQIGLDARERHGQQCGAPIPKTVGPPADEGDQGSAEKQISDAT